ncbi:LamG domain-containing protein [Streptomyces profundus]|uniref:LamG domain-containing protein n=1 Tax=Streptomyces profundus TaxID=2867410 RepID=UPI001D161652|nr:LamG domain-containing protein [Streptomyces sp. MA3_2.13]UED86456.1 LamG domain-containing protein [Streptomyces sp. MA3_2.13]
MALVGALFVGVSVSGAAASGGGPDQIRPGQLRLEYGGACAPADQPGWARSRGQVYADAVTDPDGDQVAVEFAASWDAGDGAGDIVRWTSGLSTSKRSGSTFSVRLPNDLPADTPVRLAARSHDGGSYSPWSDSGDGAHACHFTLDTGVPAAPTVFSADYPELIPGDPFGRWHEGAGHYGEFTLSSPDDDVTRYTWRLTGGPGGEVVSDGGAPQTVRVLPSTVGPHSLTAQAIDRAGNVSPPTTYHFLVAAGAPPRAGWALEDEAGEASERWAALDGGATAGAEGVSGAALALDGVDGHAVTERPLVNTDRSFSVSAWVKLDQVPTEPAVVASQSGTHRSGFELYYSAADDSWAFGQHLADRPDDDRAAVALASDTPVVSGEWTRLVGAYDAERSELRLFVDGELAASTPHQAAWNARGPVWIGAVEEDGEPGSAFPGLVDEVRFFDHVAYPSDGGRPAVAFLGMDEPAGAERVSAAAEVPTAQVHGGAEFGAPAVYGDGLRLDGTSGYAGTGTPVLDTTHHFAVAAWVLLDELPAEDAVVAAQAGQDGSGLQLFYAAERGAWAFGQPGDEEATAIGGTAEPDEWTSLVGVQDAYAGTLTLYVNGDPAGTAPIAEAGNAGGPLLLGTDGVGAFFPGVLDDVRLYDRVVTEFQARQLYHQAPVPGS